MYFVYAYISYIYLYLIIYAHIYVLNNNQYIKFSPRYGLGDTFLQYLRFQHDFVAPSEGVGV